MMHSNSLGRIIAILTFLTLILSSHYSLGQNAFEVANELIRKQRVAGSPFNAVEPFQKTKLQKDIEIFSLKERTGQASISNQKNLAIQLPSEILGNLTLIVTKIDHIAPSFTFTTSGGNQSKANDFSCYRGIVEGMESNSLVTLTIRKNYLRALISIDGENYVLGQYNNKSDKYAFVNERSYSNPTFTCDWNESLTEKPYSYNMDSQVERTTFSETNPVGIYFETDYSLYNNLGGSTTAVENYLVSMFNELSTVYAGIGVPLTFASSFIWTSNDIYANQSSTGDMLQLLRSTRTNVQADLVHLLSGRALGGVAYLNALCGTARYGVSGSQFGNPSTLPKSSFTLIVVAHELGHNLGSAHTHSCVWNGNNTRIDNCGGKAGYPSGSCEDPSDPFLPDRGTIMSYCHLVGGVGSYYEFHEQVADRIFNYVSSSSCLDCDDTQASLTCTSALTITGSGTYQAIGPNCGYGCNNCEGATKANWYVFTPSQKGKITIGSCDGGADTRLFIYTGNCSTLNQVAYNDDFCSISPQSSYPYASLIENFNVEKNTPYFFEWDNRWSSSGFNFEFSYTPDPYVTIQDCTQENKIFSQISSNQQVVGNHSSITTNANIQSGQNITMVASKSITLSPGFTAAAGSSFTAYIEDCSPLAETPNIEIPIPEEKIIETNKEVSATINLFPNPFNENLLLEFLPATNGFVQIFVYNLQGQELLSIFEEEVFESVLITRNLPLSSLKAGMYFVTIKTATDHYTRKIIKVQ